VKNNPLLWALCAVGVATISCLGGLCWMILDSRPISLGNWIFLGSSGVDIMLLVVYFALVFAQRKASGRGAADKKKASP